MALSGTITGTTSSNAIQSRIRWSATQDIENNTSTITAYLDYQLTSGAITNTSGTFNGKLKAGAFIIADGSKSFSLTNRVWKNVYSGKRTFTHNADGTLTVTLSATGSLSGTPLTSTSCRGEISVNPIVRAATITAAPDFTDEDNPTITYSNPGGSAVDSLAACISITGEADNVGYREIDKTGTTYTFELTETERDTLRYASPNSNTIPVYFFIKTSMGGTEHLSSLQKTLTIINSAPIVSATAKDIDYTTLNATGNADIVVKGYTDINYTITATALKGATITGYKALCGDGKSSTESTGTLNNVSSNVFTFSATDSRGNTTNHTINKQFIDYTKLTNNTRGTLNADGELTIYISGNYYNGSFGSNANTLTTQYRYKLEGSEYSDNWITIDTDMSGNTYAATDMINGLNYKKSYIIQTRVYDNIDIVYSSELKINAYPVFDWGKEDFAVNVNTAINGDMTITGDIIIGGRSLKELLGI